MGKGRVEAFTDGVVAIIITIMVLELRVPHGEDVAALLPLWQIFFCYVLSFVDVGIYWNNLRDMFHTVQRVDGRVLWANLNLPFRLSLMPATTAFMGENHFAPVPFAVYGIDLVLCAVAYIILAAALHRLDGNDTALHGHRQCPQGQALAGCLACGRPADLRQSVDRRRALCAGRDDWLVPDTASHGDRKVAFC